MIDINQKHVVKSQHNLEEIKMAIIKSQRTKLYFVDPTDDALVVVGCPTSISGLDSTNEQVEVTCLGDTDRQYESGLSTPSTVTFTIQFDATDESHLRLKELHESGAKVSWAIGFGINGGDLTVDPEVDSDGSLSNPGGRSFLFFRGFVSSFSFDFALNAMVTSSLTIQMSGQAVLSPQTP